MTPPVPARDTRAGQVYNDLRNLARRDGRDPAEYFTLYALEGFLARLAGSEYSADFVLKGGVLMAAFAARRPVSSTTFLRSSTEFELLSNRIWVTAFTSTWQRSLVSPSETRPITLASASKSVHVLLVRRSLCTSM